MLCALVDACIRILDWLLCLSSALSVALPLLNGRSSIAGHRPVLRIRHSCMGAWISWASVYVIDEQVF
jgi:hypothetical protein